MKKYLLFIFTYPSTYPNNSNSYIKEQPSDDILLVGTKIYPFGKENFRRGLVRDYDYDLLTNEFTTIVESVDPKYAEEINLAYVDEKMLADGWKKVDSSKQALD